MTFRTWNLLPNLNQPPLSPALPQVKAKTPAKAEAISEAASKEPPEAENNPTAEIKDILENFNNNQLCLQDTALRIAKGSWVSREERNLLQQRNQMLFNSAEQASVYRKVLDRKINRARSYGEAKKYVKTARQVAIMSSGLRPGQKLSPDGSGFDLKVAAINAAEKSMKNRYWRR